MATICFYQDSRHDRPLKWIREVFSIGYISKRNDGMTELRINGFSQIRNILSDLLPFIRFKTIQAKALLKAADILSKKALLDKNDLLRLVNYILIIQRNNYVSRAKKNKQDLLKILSLTP